MWGTVRDCPIYPSRIVQIHAHGQGGCMEHGWYIIPWSQKQARTAASSNNFESSTIIGFRDPGCNLPRFKNCFDQRWLNGLCIQTLFSYRSSVCSVWRIGGMESDSSVLRSSLCAFISVSMFLRSLWIWALPPSFLLVACCLELALSVPLKRRWSNTEVAMLR